MSRRSKANESKNKFPEGFVDSVFQKGKAGKIDGIADEGKFNELLDAAKEAGDEDLFNILQYVGYKTSPEDVGTLKNLLGEKYKSFFSKIANGLQKPIIEQLKLKAVMGKFIDSKQDWGVFVPQKKKHTKRNPQLAEIEIDFTEKDWEGALTEIEFTGDEWADALSEERTEINELNETISLARTYLRSIKKIIY